MAACLFFRQPAGATGLLASSPDILIFFKRRSIASPVSLAPLRAEPSPGCAQQCRDRRVSFTPVAQAGNGARNSLHAQIR